MADKNTNDAKKQILDSIDVIERLGEVQAELVRVGVFLRSKSRRQEAQEILGLSEYLHEFSGKILKAVGGFNGI